MDAPPPNPSIDLKGRRILVVDDDRVNLRIIAGILRHEGYEISEATSGEQALEIYAESRPNLVLLDVMMPGIDGFETCRIIKKTYAETSAPVIFITAKSEADDVVMGFDAGGVDYLTKPFRPKEVLARIRTHLSNQLLVEQLSKANAAKDRFLGMCAHDLRNPLSSIRGLAELMSENAIGSLQKPLSDAALEAKFADLADGILPKAQAQTLMQMCWNIADSADAGAVARAAAV